MQDIVIPAGLGEGDTFVENGLKFTIKNGDLTVRDLDLGEYVYEETVSRSNTKAYKARALARRHLAEIERVGTVYSVSEQYVKGNGAAGEASAFYLTEAPLYHLVALTRTPKGAELRIAMTKVFFAWRKRKLVSLPEPGRADPSHEVTTRERAVGVTSFQGLIYSDVGGRLHIHSRSVADALGITPAQLDGLIASKPHIGALDDMPPAPAGRYMSASHVDVVCPSTASRCSCMAATGTATTAARARGRRPTRRSGPRSSPRTQRATSATPACYRSSAGASWSFGSAT